jgi:hypothetical protein
MTKQPKGKGNKPSGTRKPKVQYPCRCYALIDGGYDMYKFNPKTGLYEGPTSCTKAECIKCNMSQAALITK